VFESTSRPLRFGIFLAPFHQTDENPTLAIERDFELVEHLDRLGFDEAWIGEHHSGGLESAPASRRCRITHRWSSPTA
jgi:limonene 1,2-monooxygenase